MRSVENQECRKIGVWKLRMTKIPKGTKIEEYRRRAQGVTLLFSKKIVSK